MLFSLPAILHRSRFTIFAVLCYLLLAGCGPNADSPATEATGSGLIPILEGSEVFELQAISPDTGIATVIGQAPEWEHPRTVRVSLADAAIFRSGQSVRGVPGGTDQDPRLDQLWPVDEVLTPRFRQATRDLQRTAAGLGPNVIVTEGDAVPNFGLVNHRGEAITLRDFHGRQVVLNFVFTRCGDINMCPAANARMRELAQTVRNRSDIAQPVFLVVSFDPLNDAPGVLHLFAGDMNISYPDFHYASGSPEIIDALLRLFGVRRNAVDGTFEHTMVTVLIDGGGRIQYRRDGSYWTLDEFLSRFNPAPSTP